MNALLFVSCLITLSLGAAEFTKIRNDLMDCVNNYHQINGINTESSNRLKRTEQNDLTTVFDEFAQDNYLIEGNRILVSVIPTKMVGIEQLSEALKAVGIDILAKTDFWVDAWIDLKDLEMVALLPEVDTIDPVTPSLTNAGSVVNEAFVANDVDVAIQEFGFTGKGVHIGVISDSANSLPQGLEQSFASNDLPRGRVTVLKDLPNRTDEGRAMMEIIHDLAPGASFSFAAGVGSAAVGADSIRLLSEAGCDIIVDDITYFGDPVFFPGIVAREVQKYIETHPTSVYLTSAGNFANDSYEGFFKPIVVDGETFHEFAPGKHYLSFAFVDGLWVLLYWDEIWRSFNGNRSGAETDLDIVLIKDDSLQFQFDLPPPTFSGRNRIDSRINNTNRDAFETYRNRFSGLVYYRLLIRRRSGGGTPYMKIIWPQFFNILEKNLVGYGTAIGQANSPFAVSVSACDFNSSVRFDGDPATVQSYSSWGGVFVRRNMNQEPITPTQYFKPDVAAADNGLTSFFGNKDSNGNFRFKGSSAAAPAMAAIAALMMEASQHKMLWFQYMNTFRSSGSSVQGDEPIQANVISKPNFFADAGLYVQTAVQYATFLPPPSVAAQFRKRKNRRS